MNLHRDHQHGKVTQWFHVSPSGPHSARGSITRKMVRKRAVSRVYTSGMGDLLQSWARVRARVRLSTERLGSVRRLGLELERDG